MSSKNYKRQKKRNHNIIIISIVVYVLLILILVLCLSLLTIRMKQHRNGSGTTETEEELTDLLPFLPDFLFKEEPQTEKIFRPESQTEGDAETEADTDTTETAVKQQVLTAADLDLQEEDIYTFLQGPKAWKTRTDWSGSWNSVVFADQEFSVFGCGLCDLANIYSTLTPYDCSPLDMLAYADEVTDYHPVAGFGAIDWPYMKQTLKKTGISSKLKRKDKTYEQFQANIASGITAIVLISSSNDSTYWKGVSGHYVNIWMYNKYDDTVFLADSGDPEHNRQRIPLRYIYDALKTSGRYQYLLVTSVDPAANEWQHDGIDIKWRKPRYYNK
ncbi:MAG: hypothetical protein Q4B59_00975 [Lachnospiraceae bacterium]|nr:hypothetical protein [Lachnospiraceae bacterium]